MLPIYIARLCGVRFIDTGTTIKITLTDKNVYGYLTGIGHNSGYHSIYPNIDQIAYHLGVNEKTVRRSIKTLEETKLIKVMKVTKKGKFESNHYWMYRPNMVDRVEWLDIRGNVLKGKHYNFNYKQFHKTELELKADKMLNDLLKLIKDNEHE